MNVCLVVSNFSPLFLLLFRLTVVASSGGSTWSSKLTTRNDTSQWPSSFLTSTASPLLPSTPSVLPLSPTSSNLVSLNQTPTSNGATVRGGDVAAMPAGDASTPWSGRAHRLALGDEHSANEANRWSGSVRDTNLSQSTPGPVSAAVVLAPLDSPNDNEVPISNANRTGNRSHQLETFDGATNGTISNTTWQPSSAPPPPSPTTPMATIKHTPDDQRAPSHCPPQLDLQHGIEWPRTELGSLAVQSCPGESYYGTVYRTCLGTGRWDQANFSDCRLMKLRQLQTLVSAEIVPITSSITLISDRCIISAIAMWNCTCIK